MSDIKKLSIKDKEYPAILKEISDPPKLMYWRGNLDALKKQPAIAVVGTRRCSEYGREATEKIVSGLAEAQICIVSGMARGIDSYAHKTALNHNTTTIAVLGSPINDREIYPQTNVKLAHKIIESGGLILSEYEEGSLGHAGQFPQRNRIVAGLSRGVLVVEAPQKSGAMITARLALENNRDVSAVPGSIFSHLSRGCNDLITRGAKCVKNADDILEELNINYKIDLEVINKNVHNLKEEEQQVLNIISDTPEAIHIDKIIQITKLNMESMSKIITTLVLRDLIKESAANSYIAISL